MEENCLSSFLVQFAIDLDLGPNIPALEYHLENAQNTFKENDPDISSIVASSGTLKCIKNTKLEDELSNPIAYKLIGVMFISLVVAVIIMYITMSGNIWMSLVALFVIIISYVIGVFLILILEPPFTLDTCLKEAETSAEIVKDLESQAILSALCAY